MSAQRAVSAVELDGAAPEGDGDDSEVFGVRLSVGLHAALVAAILIKALVFPGKPIMYVPSLRVDLVGLPDVLKKDLNHVTPSKEITDALKRADQELKKVKPLPPPPKMKEPVTKAEPDEMVYKPKSAAAAEAQREKEMKASLERIEALSKITDDAKPAPQALIKGNKISKGTSLSGEARESADASYFDSLRDRLSDNWALPVWVARQDLSAQVQIYIDAHGRLDHFRFVKTSGNSQFDDAVKKALRESAPFPAPPDELAPSVLARGVLVGFPL